MPSANDAIVTFNFTTPVGEEAAVVRHVHKTGGALNQADLITLGASFVSWWEDDDGPVARARVHFNNNLVLDDVTLTQMAGVPPLQVVTPSGLAGESALDAPPPESALVTTWYTGSPGRSFRGRSFWPSYATDAIGDNGTFLPASLAVIQDAFDRLLAVGSPPGFEFVVYSRTLDVTTEITSVVLRSIPHHQSRRNP